MGSDAGHSRTADRITACAARPTQPRPPPAMGAATALDRGLHPAGPSNRAPPGRGRLVHADQAPTPARRRAARAGPWPATCPDGAGRRRIGPPRGATDTRRNGGGGRHPQRPPVPRPGRWDRSMASCPRGQVPTGRGRLSRARRTGQQPGRAPRAVGRGDGPGDAPTDGRPRPQPRRCGGRFVGEVGRRASDHRGVARRGRMRRASCARCDAFACVLGSFARSCDRSQWISRRERTQIAWLDAVATSCPRADGAVPPP
jgi:hypothetical protein